MKRRNAFLFLFLLILITVFAVAALCIESLYKQRAILYISHDSGIYDESIMVTVRSNKPGTIYYTEDGERPEPDEMGALPQGAREYEGPLTLELQEDTTAYSFQFYFLPEDGSVSEIYKRNYILDAREERFSTTYVVSIFGDEEKLFDYEEGIFVRGRQFDEYMAENPDVNLLNGIVPANYFSDTEVPVNAAVFTKDGTEILSQNCGLKIYGNWTRAKNQKSFRLIARYDYDFVNEFSYPFLPKLVSEESRTVVDAFQRLSFHNSGDDNGYGFIRTEIIGELARLSGYPDVLISESATVYLNGKYQGVYWLVNTYDDRYFREKYGKYDGEMVVCQGNLSQMQTNNVETKEEIQFAEDYNNFCEWAKTADMSDDDNWNYACNVIDVENFARYTAIEYYIGNIDWPHNNVKVYRYKCAEDEDYSEGSVFDGRYRYLLFDTDYGMGLKTFGWYGLDATDKRLDDLSENIESASLFRSLLNREEFKTLFIQAVMHLMGGSFSETVVSDVLNEYDAKRHEELRHMMEETDVLKNSIWESDDNNMENVAAELAEIIDFARCRPDTVLEEMQDKWECGRPVRLCVTSEAEGNIVVGGLKTGESKYAGLCLANVPLHIMVEPVSGVTVTGYYVNSVFVEGEEIELIPAEWLEGEDDSILIRAAVEIEPVESLVISAYHIRGQDDYVVLQNNGQISLRLSDYALTDSREEWSKGRLPEKKLEPGEKYVVYGQKYSGNMEKNSVQVPFSWNTEEEILLIHVSKGIVDSKNRGLKRLIY